MIILYFDLFLYYYFDINFFLTYFQTVESPKSPTIITLLLHLK
jgi:hypothetical protein